jgi:hypothetical protein
MVGAGVGKLGVGVAVCNKSVGVSVVGVGEVAHAVNAINVKMNRNAIIGTRLRLFGLSE